MQAPAQKRSGRRRRAFLAASLSTLLSLLGAELFCRVRYGAPLRERLPLLEIRANRERGYEMVPDRDHYTYEHPVHVNHLGLRGRDLPEKTAEEVRILCLGDSTTFGQGLPEAETLPALLEESLSRRASAVGRTVHVINGGLRGYATVHELALLRELGPRLRPDVIVLMWYINDLERPDIARLCESLSRSGPVALDTRARMEGWPLAEWRGRQVLRSSALLMKLHDLLVAQPIPDLTDDGIRVGLELFDRDLEELVRLSKSLGSELVIAPIPHRIAIRGPAPWDLLVRRIGEHARARGIPVIELLPELRELYAATGRLPILAYDGHYTGEGNAAMARKLADALSARLATQPR